MQQRGSQSWLRQAVLCFFNKSELLSICIAEGTSSSWQGKQPSGAEPLQHLQKTSPVSKIAWLKHLPALVTPRYMNCNTFTNTICGGGAHRGFITDASLLAELERELTTSFYMHRLNTPFPSNTKDSLAASHTSCSNGLLVSLFICLMFVCWVWGGCQGQRKGGIYVLQFQKEQ